MEILWNSREVNKRIGELAAEITRFYAGKPLTVSVVLNGGLFFGAALSRRLKLKDLYIDTLAISSYEHDRSNGNM
ncbi:MAG: hypothetical protein PHI35_05825, partial [Victivallaceae bacterium]|nr:hypothetical protein [Victivallaceae bacterium]